MKMQVALITPLMHVKGHASAETKAAAEKAHLFIEKAEAVGEPPEDPMLLFSVLYSNWAANYVAFNGDAMRELSEQFLDFAEKQRRGAGLLVGHRLPGCSLVLTGDIVRGRTHLDRALAMYKPVQHGSLSTRFGQDIRVATLVLRSWTLWVLGYAQAALRDAEQGLNSARAVGQAAGLLYVLNHTSVLHMLCGNYAVAQAEADEVVSLANEKGSVFWKAHGVCVQGCLSVLTGKASEAVDLITSGITGLRSTGATQL